jgi:hypothetical protein
MAINFSNNKTLSETGTKLSAPGRIVQVIQTTNTSNMATSSTNPVDFFTSATITLTNASNKILVEWHSDNRTDGTGDGGWSLYYMDLIHVQTGTQLSYTGYRGELTPSIRHYRKSYMHTPGSVGPHSYKIRGWSYAAYNTNFGTAGTGNDGISYIRMTEIAV